MMAGGRNQVDNEKNKAKQKVAIVGWSGYSGLELAKLIHAHPGMELASGFSRNLENRCEDLLPTVKPFPIYSIENLTSYIDELDAIFFATPANVSEHYLPLLQKHSNQKAIQLIDLSGQFRLNENAGFVYGLQPWQKETSNWVSNPGCYVSSVLMALIPLLKESLIDDVGSIVIDAKSGTTGAGKSLHGSLMFSEVAGNCTPYKVGNHQHLPEITHYLKDFSGREVAPFFTTHLLPTPRGIISSIYAKTSASEQDIAMAYNNAYEGYGLAKFCSIKESSALLKLQNVVGTAATHISFQVTGGKLFLFSVIDNLMKGAASQAVENWNVMNGWSVETGLVGPGLLKGQVA